MIKTHNNKTNKMIYKMIKNNNHISYKRDTVKLVIIIKRLLLVAQMTLNVKCLNYK